MGLCFDGQGVFVLPSQRRGLINQVDNSYLFFTEFIYCTAPISFEIYQFACETASLNWIAKSTVVTVSMFREDIEEREESEDTPDDEAGTFTVY